MIGYKFIKNVFVSENLRFLKKFYVEHGFRHKGKLIGLFIGAILSGLFEILGLITLYMLLRLLINVNALGEDHFVIQLASFFGAETKNQIILFMGVSITLIFILKNIYVMGYYYYQHHTLKIWKAEISASFMEKYLHAPYSFLLGYNSATIIRNINNIVNSALNGFVLAGFNFFANLIVGFIILNILLFMYFDVTLIIAGILIFSTYLQNFFLKKKSIQLGEERNQLISDQNKNVYQGIHAVKETKVIGREGFFLKAFEEINKKTIANDSMSLLLSRLPSHLTEIVVIVSIVIICGSVLYGNVDNTEKSISSLGILAAVAFRISPVMNRLLGAMQGMDKNLDSIKTMFTELKKLRKFEVFSEGREAVKSMPFNHDIRFENVSYQYPKAKVFALEDINVTIKKGQFVAIVGESGAGKTTLVDLLLGLISPKEGRLFVDDKSVHKAKIKPWQKNLGYVPQSIYLNDDTVMSNVAFGLDTQEIDIKKVRRSLETVNMLEFISGLEDGIESTVGENGKKLSGGQRQRLGIARALYLDSQVLVLDEATSALDVPTESKIATAINKLKGDKTVVVIAHRLSTVINADHIIMLKQGRVVGQGTYNELYNKNSEFKEMSDLSHITPSVG